MLFRKQIVHQVVAKNLREAFKADGLCDFRQWNSGSQLFVKSTYSSDPHMYKSISVTIYCFVCFVMVSANASVLATSRLSTVPVLASLDVCWGWDVPMIQFTSGISDYFLTQACGCVHLTPTTTTLLLHTAELRQKTLAGLERCNHYCTVSSCIRGVVNHSIKRLHNKKSNLCSKSTATVADIFILNLRKYFWFAEIQ